MAVPFHWNSIHCGVCRIRIAFKENVVTTVWPGGIFTRLFNVNNVNYHQARVGTVADTYCAQCGWMLGWKFIVVTRQHRLYREGRFALRLDRLRYSRVDDQDGDITDLEEGGDSNDENADQDVGANGQNADQDLGANGQNADQDLGANEQVPKEKEVGENERNANQDGGNNQQVPNEQHLGANEQNADQDGGGNEQNDDDEDGGRPTKRRKME